MIPDGVQCREESQRHSRWFSQAVKELEEEEERKIHSMGTQYEHKLHAEQKTNKNLKGEAGAVTQNVSSTPSRRPPVGLC